MASHICWTFDANSGDRRLPGCASRAGPWTGSAPSKPGHGRVRPRHWPIANAMILHAI